MFIVQAIAAFIVLVGCVCIYDILRDIYESWEWRHRMVLRFKTERTNN